MKYEIVWFRSKNPLGETESIECSTIEEVIRWVVDNHFTMTEDSAGYTVYMVDEEGFHREHIWHWQEDVRLCFGDLWSENYNGHSFQLILANGKIQAREAMQKTTAQKLAQEIFQETWRDAYNIYCESGRKAMRLYLHEQVDNGMITLEDAKTMASDITMTAVLDNIKHDN